MSSHREAPEISKDPVADNTDTYAFVSPGQAGHGHDHHQLRAARGPAGRPELLRVRRRRPLLDPRRQRRRRPGRHRATSSRSTTKVAKPEHVPLQHRADHLAQQPELEPAPVLHGDPQSTATTGTAGPRCSARPALPARATSGPARPRTTRRSPTPAVHTLRSRREGVRRPATRRLLRRPRLDLRPRRPAPVPEPAPDRHSAGDGGVDATRDAATCTRSPPGADQRPHARRLDPDRPDARPRPSSASGPRPAGGRRACSTRANDEHVESGPWVQVSRLGNPLFNEVIVPMARKDYWNALDPAADKQFAKYVDTPSWRSCCRCSTRACSRTSRRYDRPKRADLVAILLTGIPAGIIPGFQNFTGTRRPTCCGSTWPSRRPREPEQPRPPRRRPGRLPQRPPGRSTTWSPSSCGRSPVPPSRWSTPASRRTPPPRP